MIPYSRYAGRDSHHPMFPKGEGLSPLNLVAASQRTPLKCFQTPSCKSWKFFVSYARNELKQREGEHDGSSASTPITSSPMPSSHSPNSPSKDADGRREREQGEGKEEKERKRKEMMAQKIKIFHIKFFNKVGCGAHALIPVFQGQRLVDL